MEHEISLGFLLKTLKKCWLLIIIIALVTAITVGAAVSIFIDKKYSSSVEFYVVNTNTSYDYTTSALLAASEYLIADYVDLIKSDAVLDEIAAEVKATGKTEYAKKATAESIRGLISSSSGDSTSLFAIKVTHTDPEYACEVAKAIEKVAPGAVTDIAKPDRLTNQYLYDVAWKTMLHIEKNYLAAQELEPSDSAAAASIRERYDGDVEKAIEDYLKDAGLDGSLDCFTTVNKPTVDKSADSPSVLKYAGVAAIAVAVLIYAIFLIKGILAMSVSSEDDVKKFVKRPLVGVVPHWEGSQKK